MAPTTTVAAPETTPSEDPTAPATPPTPALVNPLRAIAPQADPIIPGVNTLNAHLGGHLDHWIEDQRDRRDSEADHHDDCGCAFNTSHSVIRGLQDVREELARYRDLLADLDKHIVAEIDRETRHLVGLDDRGIPKTNLTLDAGDGTTIEVKRKWRTARIWDVDQVVHATAGLIANRWTKDQREVPDAAYEFAAATVTELVDKVFPSSTTNLKITGVEAVAALLDAAGETALSEVCHGAYIGDKVDFAGIEVVRHTPTQDAAPKRKRITRKPAPPTAA
jgi:hypothetical protein